MRYFSDLNIFDLVIIVIVSFVYLVVLLIRKLVIIIFKKDLIEDEFFFEIFNWKVQSFEDLENNKKYFFLF